MGRRRSFIGLGEAAKIYGITVEEFKKRFPTKILAIRGMPHQGKQECARRVAQHKRGMLTKSNRWAG